jgi:ribosomal-protein-alanine N-acetyltransferase
MIPILETSRLTLAPLSRASANAYETFYTNAAASSLYGGPISAGAAHSRLAADLGSWYLHGFGVWAVQLKSNNQCIGTCGFWQGLGWPRELTWWVLPDFRGKGIAKEASLAAIRHAYETFEWPVVETYMNDENTPAKALVLSLGGNWSRRQTFPDGLQRDVFVLPRAAA